MFILCSVSEYSFCPQQAWRMAWHHLYKAVLHRIEDHYEMCGSPIKYLSHKTNEPVGRKLLAKQEGKLWCGLQIYQVPENNH